MKKKKGMPLYAQILIGMVLGVICGLAAGSRASGLGEVGKLVIQLIKALAAPLLFLAIVDAFLRAHVRIRSALVMLGVAAVNAAVALGIGLGLSNWLQPGRALASGVTAAPGAAPAAPAARDSLDFFKTLAGYIPSSVLQPFADNAIIPLVLLAVLTGLALRRVVDSDPAHEPARAFVTAALRATEVMLGWIIRLVPLAVFGVVAKTVGEKGFAPFRGLAAYLGVALLGLALQIAIVYQGWIVLVARRGLRWFWSGARDAVVYALGASSSLATLPVTLRCLERMGVSMPSARLVAGVGTNLNNDGILLYEAMAVLFVAQAHGIELTAGQQVAAALSCALAGMGIAGIPDAGLISLSLVLAAVGLPTELLPLLLTVDWVLSRARATTNVIADVTGSVVVDRLAPAR
jgi:DAACS family dicarboxylate/amino acid:cation (Na+ or H+) symporter